MAEREVVVLGVGVTKFGRVTGRNPIDLAREAGIMAMKDAGVSPKDIQMGFSAHCYQPGGYGMVTFGEMGIMGPSVTNVEVACTSCSRGAMHGAEAIAAGSVDMVLINGSEVMPRGMVPMIGDMSNMPYEMVLGLMPMPGAYAMMATRHMHLYGTKPEHFAQVGVKAHKNGSLNPNATYREVFTLEQVMQSRMIADPITMYQCSANADGGTAVVLCSKEKAKQYTTKPVFLSGWAAGTPPYNKEDPMPEEADTADLARQLYNIAGVGPEDVRVVQLHDAFAPGEVIGIEKLGLCPKGEGGPYVWEGGTEITGKTPVNTDGGLLSCGHPIGATGGRMVAEITWQLREACAQRQVTPTPKVGLLQNSGYGGGTVMLFRT